MAAAALSQAIKLAEREVETEGKKEKALVLQSLGNGSLINKIFRTISHTVSTFPRLETIFLVPDKFSVKRPLNLRNLKELH